MKKRGQLFILLYALISIADLLFIYLNQPVLRWITKPLLMPLLAASFYLASFKHNGRLFYCILIALFLSWCGDVLLQLKGMFIPGLVCFLLAHVSYIFYFLHIHPRKKGMLQQQPLLGLPVLIYIVVFLYVLYPFLGVLKIPVTVYGITISTMLLLSFNMRRKTGDAVATYFLSGAILFVISDSLLAVNLFASGRMLFSLFVMVTYAAAQYLIVKGALKYQQDLKTKSFK